MRYLRRLLQVVALVGTITVGIVAVALIVSQTPWFKDWLRRYIVRESKQYLNGQLTIGRLGGNLLFGVNLSDVAVDVSGERVVAARALELDYSVFELVSKGIVLNEIRIDQPVLRVEHDASGWNLSNLVRKQQKEADREGPGRPISLPSIEIFDASVVIDDRATSAGFNLPAQISDLDIKAGFEYAPVHYSVNIENVSFRGSSPSLALQQLRGKLAVRDDNLYFKTVSIKTGESSVTIDGVVKRYLTTPVLELTTTGQMSLPEIGRIVPAAGGYNLHPSINLKANGPARQLALDVDVRSEAGAVRGTLTADVAAPNFAARGTLDLERLNLAPLLKDPAQKTDLTGRATIDLTLASAPGNAPVTDRLGGTFAFAGPHVAAAGYEARAVAVKGSIDGPRITLDGRASAYGGTATARGFIVTPASGRALSFDLRGAADNVDLRGLPPSTGAPQLSTHLSIAEYHVRGEGTSTSGSAALNTSTVEGATIAGGTVAQFSVAPDTLTYGARGSVADLNLQRLGRVLKVAALSTPTYDSRINGAFDVKGSMPRTPARAGRGAGEPSAVSSMTLDATGTLRDSDLLGGRLPEMGFEAHLDRGALKGRADGRFEGFNPAQISGRKELDGRVTGTVNAAVAVGNIDAPITPDAISADGTVTLTDSTIGGLRVTGAGVEGRYAAQIGDIAKLTVTGPDVKVDAAGRLALDRAGASNLKYHVEATNLTELSRLAGQDGIGGAATFDGTLTGNAASLQTTGTIDGSNLKYQENGALDLNSRYGVTVPELRFAEARVEATTEATFVEAAGMHLNAVKATTTYAQQKLDFTTNIKEQTRELDATGQVIFHTDHQEIHLPQLAVRTQGVEWRAAPGSNATVQYGRNRIELQDVRLVSGAQELDVSGTFAPNADATARAAGAPIDAIQARARNVDIKQLETLLLQNRGFTGTLTADARITGSTAAPIVDGHVEVRNGGFQTYRYDSLVATMDYAGTRVKLDATLQQSATESITARGTIPTSLFKPGAGGVHVDASAGDQIDVQVKSTPINLAMIQGFTSQVANVTGTLEVDVKVTGSGEDPHLDGFVDVKNGAFGVPAIGQSFTGLTTRIELEPDRVRIQKFQVLDHNHNPLTVAGELAVHERQIGSVNVSIDSDNFEVINNELGDVQIQSALKITGELRRPRVEGQVRLDAARLEVDRVLELTYDPYSVSSMPDVVSAERTVEGSGSAEEATKNALAKAQRSGVEPAAGAPAAPVAGGAFAPVSMDVQVVIPDNLVLRGNNLRPGGPTGATLGKVNATVGGDLRIRKNPDGPVTLFGTVNTVRGTYEFQGRRFEVVRDGTVRFIGDPQPNPILDVTATRVIPNTGVEVRVRISGSAKSPELTLSSTPPLGESDILALIVFNRPVNELGTGERSSLAATAGGIASGFIAAPLGDSIAKALDLDLFEITTTTESGELGAGVTVGQQLGDRAFVKLRQQFGDRNVSEFMIEYQLAKFLRLQATAAPETSGSANRVNQRRIERGGVDLIFFFSY